MFLFIFESIGTSELMLVGIVALLFLGPRRLPEMARKLGKMMSEFRGTANEFKETWQREVDFEAEAKALDLNSIEAESTSVPRVTAINPPETANTGPIAPTVMEVDPAAFDRLREEQSNKSPVADEILTGPTASEPAIPENDKRNWL